jgi:hypothetical protein
MKAKTGLLREAALKTVCWGGVPPTPLCQARRHPRHARIADQNMNIAVPGAGFFCCSLQLGLERHVRSYRRHVRVSALQAFDRRGECGILDIAEHHLDPGLRERSRDAEPNARRGPGDERDLPGQVFQSLLPLWIFLVTVQL